MDDLGSVANVVDSTGAVKNSYRYDPFGNSTSKTEAVSNPWQFASGYLDANTGLYKFGERYYDPTLGRWTQKDPVGGSIGNVNSTNPYVYADNVPNMLVDPSGYATIPLDECIINILGIIASDLLLGGGAALAALTALKAAGIASGAELAAFLAAFLPPFAAKFIPGLGYIALALAVIKVTADVVSYTRSNC